MSNRRAKARETAEERDELAREDYHQALKEWRAAQRAFDQATGETQVDWAIYQLQASERRFALCWTRIRFAEVDISNWKGGNNRGMDSTDHISAVFSSDF